MEHQATYTAFVGTRRVAAGKLSAVLPVLKRKWDADRATSVQVFDDESGRAVDFDLRGSLEEIVRRETEPPARGPGRPKLGVVSREVSMLPRHWDWLEEQPNGISATLRRLVEDARKSEPGKQHAARVRTALSRFLTAVAGDLPNYEEATRALFAREHTRFAKLVAKWPKDVKAYAVKRSLEARRSEPRA
ncbi:MAG: DUF2239 family protein [Planctomycetes bacterium]|nr:DUF2239 family protein [Planctomycetota bacterium]